MDIEKILRIIQQEFPSKAIDLSESLGLVKETIGDMMNGINDKMSEAFAQRDFATRKKYEADEETEKKTIPNYSDYYVDTNVEHILYEDYTHKRPCGFRINEDKIKLMVKFMLKPS
jgi:hypothetical protein